MRLDPVVMRLVKSDGSVRATRIAVADPLAVNVRRGPVLMVLSAEPVVQMQPIQGQGRCPLLWPGVQ